MGTSIDDQAEHFVAQPAKAPCALVILGGAGALARRKLAPALYNLAQDGLLPDGFAVVGAARTPRNDEEFRAVLGKSVREHSRRPPRAAVLDALLERSYYHRLRADRDDDWAGLIRRLAEIDARRGTAGGRLLYLATPPESYAPLVQAMGRSGVVGGGRTPPARIVVEKPFGTDLDSAEDLSRLLQRWFDESAIYRIDHFLGKEPVQNLLVFRFANAIAERLLCGGCVRDVQITVAEADGVGGRGSYYESAGALRDMVQNHLLQLLALVAMEPPRELAGEAVRDEKARVLRAVAAPTVEQVAGRTVRGQYVSAGGQAGYRQEEAVAPDSQVETYAAVRLEIDNERWSGVPFYLRTGKRLARSVAEIVVTFRREATALFGPEHCDWRAPNRLIFRLQPAQGISIAFDAKAPGPQRLLRPVRMDFDYERSFETASPEAYERLLLDALSGESSLFARADEVAASWRIVDAIRAGWTRPGAPRPLEYPCGTWGPPQATEIFADRETSWQTA